MEEKLNKRWFLAQEYEKNWWEERSKEVNFEFYRNFAYDLKEYIKEHIVISEETSVLEIGSGAGGILTYLKSSKNRYAIDPLENFYSSIPEFVEQRDNTVKYISAKGEDLPFEEEMFDLVIMDNVLDHCDDPEKVMTEVKRVTKDNGIIYFKQNTYHLWGRSIRFLMEKLLIDKGHPYTFSKKRLLDLFDSNRFKILKSKRTGYLNTWQNEISSSSLKDKLKALLFVTRDKVTYLLKNLPPVKERS